MKICNGCNSGNNDNAKYCQKCGNDIENISPLLNTPSGGGIYAPTNDYTRLGGWLLFFTVWDIITFASAVLSLLLFPLNFFVLDGSINELYSVISSIITVIPLFISVIFRFKRDSRFLLFFQISTIVSLLFSLYVFGVSPYVSGVIAPIDEAYRMMGSDIAFMDYLGAIKIFFISVVVIGSAVQFFLITLYYCRSKRVNEFMGSDEYKQKAIFKFNN